MRTVCLCFAALILSGCGLTEFQRQEIINAAGEIAARKAADLAFRRAREAGMSEQDARKAAELARREAESVSKQIVERMTSEAPTTNWKGVAASIVSLILTVVLPAAAKAKFERDDA